MGTVKGKLLERETLSRRTLSSLLTIPLGQARDVDSNLEHKEDDVRVLLLLLSLEI
jgi:hypothetical protein